MGRVDPKPAERAGPLAVPIVGRAGDLLDRGPQLFEQATSRIGRRDALRRAVQQADADPFRSCRT
jgi:hypothetical protein